MKTIKVDLRGDFSEAIQEAVAVLKLGGVIVYPTDTLYGLGANALEIGPVERIFKIKQRSKSKPLPIAVRNINWAKELAFIYKKEEKILEAAWPGAVTVVLPKRNIVPDILTAGQRSVAMRIPNSLFIDELLGKFGYPITSTSANISDELPSFKISEIIERFENSEYKPDLVIDAGDLKQSEPSTVLDLTTDKPKILRIGPSKPETLLKLLEI
ncbi:MAG: L-threonylcarbamoyladenylate synthase [Patescibacteria group bacterium]